MNGGPMRMRQPFYPLMNLSSVFISVFISCFLCAYKHYTVEIISPRKKKGELLFCVEPINCKMVDSSVRCRTPNQGAAYSDVVAE